MPDTGGLIGISNDGGSAGAIERVGSADRVAG
jgi:hypothetical protein